MGKEGYLLFTITFGIPFWVLGGHESIIVTFFILFSHTDI